MNCPLAQNGPELDESAHPAIENASAIVSTGMADTNTRGDDEAGVAAPKCEHMTVAPR